MQLLSAIVLGLIQGLTEFLPVSSSGHLVIGEYLLGFEKPDISFDVLLHVGTLFAVLIYFRRDIIQLLGSLWPGQKGPEIRARRITVFLIAVSTFATGIVYALFKDPVEAAFDSPVIAAVMLSVTALILMIANTIPDGKRKASDMGWFRAFIIGLAQSVALMPGISRSGSTISAGIFCGLDRSEAARYSFLLAIPAIAAAAVVKTGSLATLNTAQITQYAAGTIAAFISGYAVISLLLRMVRKKKLHWFAFYCQALSMVFLLSTYL